MYRIINFCAFVACLVWLYVEPSPEPVVVLLLSTAGFFRDDIHGVIGKNIFTLTPKNKLIRDFSSSKFSFISSELINPRILEDLVGWLSDGGDQIVSINITESNMSNRYHGSITSEEIDSGYPIITSAHEEGAFSYRYLGCSFSGVHLIQTWDHGGGSGVFCNVLLVTLSQDSAIEYEKNKIGKVDRFVVKLVSSIPLGDRYEGALNYKFGFLSIPACKGIRSLRESKSTLLVL
ncbi:hypothetical protein [uncultured Psychromonas sp.]|uniref:hypothetical protein n=1 Tax=uncultured Psychromonas sp. TaxID=173974 RepID=UPI00262C1B8A|nr:hypothetical protein [uncultured Psychromonas sp.]